MFIFPVIGVVAAAVALIAAAIAVLACCCRKSRSGQSGAPNAAGFGNAMYAGEYDGPPPGYDNISVQKVPVYSGEPPVYEEIEKSKLPDGTGVDNPVYTHPEEVKVSVQNLSNMAKA